jgi:hypothetical protein
VPIARHVPASVAILEVSLSASAVGCLLPLVVFPVLGAGLAAWGGMAAGQPARGHGGGGGGPDGPAPSPPPGGQSLDEDREPELALSGRR